MLLSLSAAMLPTSTILLRRSNVSDASDSSSTASWTSPGAGITGGYNGDSESLRIFIVFFAGLAIYNSCELIVMIFLTFHRYGGLYFWALLASGLGIIPYALGFLLKFMNFTTGRAEWVAVAFLTIGWYPMITGQALVLWSRLHLIVSGERGERVIRYTKWMIIVNAICLHIPTTVLTVGANGSVHTHVFEVGYNIMEKIQMVGFFCQEVVLSSIYIVETVKILRNSLRPNTRKTMRQLVAINATIILMDLGLLGLESASLYILETLLKGIVYSIKLKLEFAILGKLVNFVGGRQAGAGIDLDLGLGFGLDVDDAEKRSLGGRSGGSSSLAPGKPSATLDPNTMDVSDFVDLSRSHTHLTTASATASRPSAAGGPPRDSLHSRRKTARDDFEYDLARFEHVEDVRTLGYEGNV